MRSRVRVLVDAANLKPGQGGIRTYTLGLIGALAQEPRVSLVVAASVDDVNDLGPLDVVRLPARTRSVVGRALWREQNLADLTRSVGADVVLAPVPELPARRLPVPAVMVVHDVGPLVAPAFYSRVKRLRYVAVLHRTCESASAVVCVTNATLVGLRGSVGIEPERCEVIGEGPQLRLQEGEPWVEGVDHILYVGSLEPRKNVETLLAAYAEPGPEIPDLLIAGPRDGREAFALNARCTKLGIGHRVHHYGYVSPERLAGLYRSASAVALPSLYEGFGLPVLEAMSAGTPVVASDIPAVREVAGESVLYVSQPLDAGAWRRSLALLGEDGVRDELANKAKQQAQRHTWEEVGRRFGDLLVRVAGQPA